MECPHCHAKNSFRASYGATGTSLYYDGGYESTTVSGATCYNCGQWIEPPAKVVMPEIHTDISLGPIHKPASSHRTIASMELRDRLAPHLGWCVKLIDSGMGWRQIVEMLAKKKRVHVSYSTLRLWFYEMTGLPRTIARRRAA